MIEKRIITEETKKVNSEIAKRGRKRAKLVRGCETCKRKAEKQKTLQRLNKQQSEINAL